MLTTTLRKQIIEQLDKSLFNLHNIKKFSFAGQTMFSTQRDIVAPILTLTNQHMTFTEKLLENIGVYLTEYEKTVKEMDSLLEASDMERKALRNVEAQHMNCPNSQAEYNKYKVEHMKCIQEHQDANKSLVEENSEFRKENKCLAKLNYDRGQIITDLQKRSYTTLTVEQLVEENKQLQYNLEKLVEKNKNQASQINELKNKLTAIKNLTYVNQEVSF